MGSTALSQVMSFRHHIPKSEDLSNEEEEDQYIYKERKKHRDFFCLGIFFCLNFNFFIKKMHLNPFFFPYIDIRFILKHVIHIQINIIIKKILF